MLWIDRKLFNMELLDVSSEIAKAFGLTTLGYQLNAGADIPHPIKIFSIFLLIDNKRLFIIRFFEWTALELTAHVLSSILSQY